MSTHTGRLEMRIPADLLARVDRAAGGRGNRSAFIRMCIEKVLGEGSPETKDRGAADPSPDRRRPEPVIPPRASSPAPVDVTAAAVARMREAADKARQR
jgi:hypothetical protein